MDKLQWFKFTPTDWIMGKIQRCPEITQARFMRLICLYWNKECLLTYDDAEIEIDKEHLDLLISKKIIKLVDNFISIEFLNEQLENISETSQKRRDAVLQRWAKVKQNDTSVLQVDTSVLQNDTEKRRVEKRREDKIRVEDIKQKKFDFKNSLIEYGFEEKLVDEWIAVRKNKKATNTETSFKKFISQIQLAPEDKNEILKLVIEKDWRGFEYQWLVNLQNEFKKTIQPQQKMYGRLTEETMIKNGDMTGIINPYAIKNE